MNSRIIFLDYLRVFAVISVLIGHKYYPDIEVLITDTRLHDSIKIILSILLPMLHGGGGGVGLFFLVSGYIITHVIERESAKTFIVRRFFRIYPLFIVCLVIQLIFLYVVDGQIPVIQRVIQQASILGNLYGSPWYSLGGVEWTLGVEILFYVGMYLLKKYKIGTENLTILYSIIIIFLYVLPPIPFGGWSKGYISMYLPFLFMGSSFYLLEGNGKKRNFILILLLTYGSYFSLTYNYHPEQLPMNFMMYSFFVFLISWRFKNDFKYSAGIALFSELTYAIYLTHNWLFDYFAKWTLIFEINPIYRNIIILILLFTICYLLNYFIEKKFIKYGKKFAG